MSRKDHPGEATFVISLDTELIWGSFHRMSAERFESGYPRVRETIASILGLLEEFDIAATWAVVGHLFLDRCERDPSGAAHPDIIHPEQSWWGRDWYHHDPCSDRTLAPLWYGPDILDLIGAAKVGQEIGCHSFAHPDYGDAAMTREAAASDLDACLEAAERMGIELRSFVFPSNSEGHHDLLRERGFVAYRGLGREEQRIRRLPSAARRPARLATQIIGAKPLVGPPSERLPGLWDIPATMLLLTRTGLRRLSSHRARLHRVRAGIATAQARGALFHLWTHPWNLADDPAFHIDLLRDILETVAREREAGRLRVETMGQMAGRLSG